MRRRDVLALFTLPSITSAEAQQSWLRRIGILMASEPVDSQALGFLQAGAPNRPCRPWMEGREQPRDRASLRAKAGFTRPVGGRTGPEAGRANRDSRHASGSSNSESE
jgi:hypothetical protein